MITKEEIEQMTSMYNWADNNETIIFLKLAIVKCVTTRKTSFILNSGDYVNGKYIDTVSCLSETILEAMTDYASERKKNLLN